MADKFEVLSHLRGQSSKYKDEEGNILGSATRVGCDLCRNGDFVAGFSDIVVADRCAELLNKYGMK